MLTPHFQLKSNLPDKPIIIKNPVGKPTVMTPDVLRKLEAAFTQGATDREAVEYAQIGLTALYEYQKKHPEYAEQKEGYKLRLTLKFRNTIANNVNDVKVAQWWLERKDPELKTTSKIEHAGKLGLEPILATPDVQKAVSVYEEIREKQIDEEAKKLLSEPKPNEQSTEAPAKGL